MSNNRQFKVAVFCDNGKHRCRAYTIWYNPEWQGCCEHVVEASNGTEAKKLAIAEHKANCCATFEMVSI